MADILDKQIVGGGGLLKTSLTAHSTIPSGTSADVTINCPTDKYIRLTYLAGQSNIGGVSIAFGGRTVASGTVMRQDNSNYTTLNIGDMTGTGTRLTLQGGKNENMVLSFNSAITGAIYLNYEVLEDA